MDKTDFIIENNILVRYVGKSKDIIIPEGVTSIRSTAFAYCYGIRPVTIPDSVTSIGYCAFYNCKNLTSITIGNGVVYIGEEAFHGCKLKKTIMVKATNANMKCRDYQFELGKWHTEPEAVLCRKGFHYCKNAFDIFNYYCGTLGKDFRLFKVETNGTSEEKRGDSKRVCTDIKLVREITSLKELLNCN